MEIVDARDSDDVQAYRVKVIIRNNLLLTAIEEAGYKSTASFARAIGYTEQQLSSLVSLRKPPINANGKFCSLAKDVMEALGAAPHDLWTTEQLTMNLHRNSVDKVVTTKFLLDTNAMQSVLGGNVLQLESATYEDIETPEQNKTKKELASRIEESLDSLPMRHAKILRMRFGIGTDKEHTLEEVAEKYGVGKERIRQIEAKAMRLMRQPGRAEKIIEFLGEN
jgi:RNA polymerase primary sigma factor